MQSVLVFPVSPRGVSFECPSAKCGYISYATQQMSTECTRRGPECQRRESDLRCLNSFRAALQAPSAVPPRRPKTSAHKRLVGVECQAPSFFRPPSTSHHSPIRQTLSTIPPAQRTPRCNAFSPTQTWSIVRAPSNPTSLQEGTTDMQLSSSYSAPFSLH